MIMQDNNMYRYYKVDDMHIYRVYEVGDTLTIIERYNDMDNVWVRSFHYKSEEQLAGNSKPIDKQYGDKIK